MIQRTLRCSRTVGNAASARMAPPTGRVAAPVSEETPFRPTTKYGVASPCTTSRAPMTVKAAPTSAKPATVATSALMPTAQKWKPPEKDTCALPKACMSAGGMAAVAPAASVSWKKESFRTSGLSARTGVRLRPGRLRGIPRGRESLELVAADLLRADDGETARRHGAEGRRALPLERRLLAEERAGTDLADGLAVHVHLQDAVEHEEELVAGLPLL